MTHAHVWKLARPYLLLAAGMISLVIGRSALAEGDVFDGSYDGPKKVTFGTPPECGADGDASVTVTEGHIRYGFGAFPLDLIVTNDGQFAGRVRKGNHGGGQVLRIKGHVSSAGLEADFNVNGIHGRVCSYHWSLRKV